MSRSPYRKRATASFLLPLTVATLLALCLPAWATEYLVFTRGAETAGKKLSARSALEAAGGGTVLKEYGHIRAFKAELDERQAASLRRRPGLIVIPTDQKLYPAASSMAAHGTQVVGVVAGSHTGVCPDVGVIPFRIADVNGNVENLSWLTDASDRIVQLAGAELAGKKIVVNFSYSTDTYNTDRSWERDKAEEMEAFFQSLLAELAAPGNIFFVGAAGNSGDDLDPANLVSYPACSSADLLVSTAAHDDGYSLASFSNSGSTLVDVATPGEDIYTTELGGGNVTMDGTSFAAPFVSGVAAYLWADDPSLTAPEMKARLMGITDGTYPMDVITGGVLSPDMAFELSVSPALSGDLAPAPQAWHLDEVREMRNHHESFDFSDVVCVIWDTGVDTDHPDLADHLSLDLAEDFTGKGNIDPSGEVLIGDDDGELSPGSGGCGVARIAFPWLALMLLPYFLLSKH